MRTFHAELDGSAQTLLYESCAPTTYYEGKLYLYDFRSGTLYAYNTEANEREILFEGKYDAAFFRMLLNTRASFSGSASRVQIS